MPNVQILPNLTKTIQYHINYRHIRYFAINKAN